MRPLGRSVMQVALHASTWEIAAVARIAIAALAPAGSAAVSERPAIVQAMKLVLLPPTLQDPQVPILRSPATLMPIGQATGIDAPILKIQAALPIGWIDHPLSSMMSSWSGYIEFRADRRNLRSPRAP